MSEFFSSETSLLNLINVALGIAVLVCLFVVGRGVIKEIHVRVLQRIRIPIEHDSHVFNLESLGVTMADGGEPINELTRDHFRRPHDGDDPPNIVRSEN